MISLLQRVEKEIQRHALMPRGQRILIAVSGGVDSMVLLHILLALAPKYRWRISVAHFNHHLRGAASDADEKRVRQLAGRRKLRFFAGHGEVEAFARQARLSLEMAARKLRHEFLAATARENKIPTITLAHHADDQVELFFLRLLRGAGGEGVAGMKWRSPSPASQDITLVRPLLGLGKSELLEYARAHRIQFGEDATNTSPDILRNRIRHQLLPLLRKNYQAGLSKTVLRFMEIAGAEAEFIRAAAGAWREKPGITFDKLAVAVQRRILQANLNLAGVVADFELIEQLRENPGIFVSSGPGVSVARDGLAKIQLREHFPLDFKASELDLRLQGRAGQAAFGDREFHWVFRAYNGQREKLSKKSEAFDAKMVGNKIALRHWRSGDRFQPIGLKSAVKLQDLFVNAKIPAARRRELVLATTAAGEIFWVEGLRIGEKFKLTSKTRRQLIWCLSN